MGLLSGIVNSVFGTKQTGTANSTSNATSQTTLYPRIQSLIFGDGTSGNGGLLSQYQQLLNQPQSQASQNWANANANYLNQNGSGDLGAIRNSALGLMQGNQTPTAGATPQVQAAQGRGAIAGAAAAGIPSYAVGNMVDAPGQNNIDLTSSYQNLISGGNTNALMNSLQAGNALAGAQFKQNQQELTDNLQRNILPGIRGGAIANGQYGSSRQGIAEGLAASDLTKQLNNSNTQFGLGAAAANSSALANAYENGQNRSLAATQGLGAQQYATAFQDANTKNQAEFMNVGNQYDASKFNAGLQQQANLANQNSNNTFGLANLQAQNQANQANAGYQQQSNLANLQALLTNNAQNNSAAYQGAGLLSGLLGATGGNVGAQDMYGINRAQQVNSLFAPYLNANATTNTSQTGSQPIYSNPASTIFGGLGILGGLLK